MDLFGELLSGLVLGTAEVQINLTVLQNVPLMISGLLTLCPRTPATASPRIPQDL